MAKVLRKVKPAEHDELVLSRLRPGLAPDRVVTQAPRTASASEVLIQARLDPGRSRWRTAAGPGRATRCPLSRAQSWTSSSLSRPCLTSVPTDSPNISSVRTGRSASASAVSGVEGLVEQRREHLLHPQLGSPAGELDHQPGVIGGGWAHAWRSSRVGGRTPACPAVGDPMAIVLACAEPAGWSARAGWPSARGRCGVWLRPFPSACGARHGAGASAAPGGPWPCS